MNSLQTLTLTVLEAKVISHQYKARLAYTSVQTDQALYCWLTNFKFSS